jgi:predicted RNA-binding protein with PUA-like domain
MAKTKLKSYWLVKSEPFKYSWHQFLEDGETYWDGVRNYAARNNLKAMQKGDLVLFYHSNEGLEIVGVASVKRTAYQDPTTDDDAWVAVDLIPKHTFSKPVTLKMIKADPLLKNMEMIRLNRLSVSKVTEEEFEYILHLGQ